MTFSSFFFKEGSAVNHGGFFSCQEWLRPTDINPEVFYSYKFIEVTAGKLFLN